MKLSLLLRILHGFSATPLVTTLQIILEKPIFVSILQ